MAGPTLKPFTYTKDGGETTARKLILAENHEIATALDVTQDPNPEGTLSAFTDYQKAFSEHKKAFPTFEAWAEQNGRGIAKPNWKSFKVAGLKAA
jgi:hypothetical protein